jgi:lipoprotein-anchoring transpeptidase ErfK/SrfK
MTMETMNRREWALVIGLTLVAVSALCAVPRPQLEAASPEVASPEVARVSTVVTPSVVAKSAATATLAVTLTPTAIPPSATPRPTRTATPSPTATMTPSPTATPYPFDTRPDLARYIYIDQRSLHVYLFEHGELLRAIPCSTGKPTAGMYTPAASGEVGVYVETFYSFGTHQDNAWYLFHSVGGIYLHGLPYTYDEHGEKVYQDRDALGVRPSSHGCIRVAPEDALWLLEWNPIGVPFTVSDPYLDEWR